MSKLLFFGYGANRSSNKISQIIGALPSGQGAIIEGYRLAYQSLDQIPEPAKTVLLKIWGNQFNSYTLKKGEGMVNGVLWEISEDDFQKIKEWEFIGVWRELTEVDVRTSDGKKLRAFTEKAPEIHPISGYVDGLLYNEYEFLNLAEKQKEQISNYYNDKQIQEVRDNLITIARGR
ncbi:MAG: hypothetical protein ACD_37C00099G0004 [uncultured bacterium]|nr:MAG: hypothetical protein ACD_37C00099G0004 [uncultured bacterium]